jgi:Domain of unknown function (DUF4258)
LSHTFDQIKLLVPQDKVQLTEHALSRLVKYGIKYREVLAGLAESIIIENYPDYVHGPAVLVLQRDSKDQPVHVVWGLPASGEQVAFVVTVYRPDDRWSPDKLRRLKS